MIARADTPTDPGLRPDARDAVFGALFDAAVDDPSVMILTADTGALKFRDFAARIPDQLINVGISEQNAVGVAAGLAQTGHRVVVYGITNFVTLRALEQIKIDICCMALPVVILGCGTGYVYSKDGPTHHVLEDVAAMRVLPGLSIWSPSDYASLAGCARLALAKDGPSYIRFDKGPFDFHYADDADFSPGMARLKPGADATLVSTGVMTTQAMQVAARLSENGLDVGVVDLLRLKPVDGGKLMDLLDPAPRVITLEEHFLEGGLGSIVAEILAESDGPRQLTRFGVESGYRAEVGDREYMRSLDRLDQESLIARITDLLGS